MADNNPTYAFGQVLTSTGWGAEGVYALADVIGTHTDGRPIVPSVLVGSGGGWEPEIILDEDWLTRAVELMNEDEHPLLDLPT